MTSPQSGRPHASRREAGFTTIGALLVFALFALAGGIVFTIQLGLATSEGGQGQHGADAAALAGAQVVLKETPTDLSPGFLVPTDIPLLLGGGVCLQTGRAEASRLASANGDALTSYCYDSFRDEVSVEVSTDDGSARKAATAATGFDAGSCSLDPGFTPDDPPTDPDDEPDVQKTLIECGLLSLRVVFNPADSRFHFVDLALQLADVKPRLTR